MYLGYLFAKCLKTEHICNRYIPYPGGGEKWGGNGVGDDLYSYGFDGAYLWTGKKHGGVSKTTACNKNGLIYDEKS